MAARFVTVTQVGQVLIAEWEVVIRFIKYYHANLIMAFSFIFIFKIERSIWNFGFGNPLIVRSLMSCCGNLGNNAENSAKDRGLTCGLSEGNKDLVRATHMIERFWAPGASTTHSRLYPLIALSNRDSSS